MYRLTGQALHNGQGDRYQAYQYSAEDGSALILAYKLKGAQGDRSIPLQGLDENRIYEVRYTDRKTTFRRNGKDLMENGVVLTGMNEESSEIISLSQV
jgi:alpha-galactosidase